MTGIPESKNAKFRRLANTRVPNAVKQLELIKNLANTTHYEYSKEEVNAILKTLSKSMNELKKSFADQDSSSFRI